MYKNVTMIHPFAPKFVDTLLVAAYARVSSGKDAMLHSLSAQVSYYSDLIQNHVGWSFAGVYADEATTGTKDSRAEFQRLLKACRAGEVDFIITKSISRFARNTVTLLETVRELKELGVDVYFERENIHSTSADGELMLTILASFAQEESRSASENCKWRIRKGFADGRPNIGAMLGYRLINGVFCIMPDEAAVVRFIFDNYLAGVGRNVLAARLNALGYTTRLGERFTPSSVSVILRNEKYCGKMFLQKTYTENHLTKRKMKNNGELPMYIVENSHEPIIEPAKFDAVQKEIARRAEYFCDIKEPPKAYPFTGIIRCGICGSYFRRKHAAAGTKYQKIVWICNTFNTYGKSHCPSRQIPEDILLNIATEVCGLDEFDEALFAATIAEIRVPAVNRLVFVFHGGATVERVWENRSRRHSWDTAARQRQSEIMKRSRPA